MLVGISSSTWLGICLGVSPTFAKLGKLGRLAASRPGTDGVAAAAGFAIRLTKRGNVLQKFVIISWKIPIKPVSADISLFITAAVNLSYCGCKICCWPIVDSVRCSCCGIPEATCSTENDPISRRTLFILFSLIFVCTQHTLIAILLSRIVLRSMRFIDEAMLVQRTN